MKNTKKPSKVASQQKCFIQSEGFISRVNQDGTVILMHLSDVNSFFKLTKLTAAIWPELRRARTAEGMAAHFSALMPKHAAKIEQEMPAIFAELKKNDLIEATDEKESTKFDTPSLEMAKFEAGAVLSYDLDKIETEVLNESIYLDVFAGSDMRLKTNMEPVRGALAKIQALEGVHYNWNAKAKSSSTKVNTKQRRTGLIAQQVAEQMPELVRADQESGMLAVNYAKLNAYLVEAVKELAGKVESLEMQLAATKKSAKKATKLAKKATKTSKKSSKKK